jgi:hypothetical protein
MQPPQCEAKIPDGEYSGYGIKLMLALMYGEIEFALLG